MSEQQVQGADQALDLNNELQSRREKLAGLRENGIAFPNDFRRDSTSDKLHAAYGDKDNEELEALGVEVTVAGRMMTRRSVFRYPAGRWRPHSAVRRARRSG